jgi:hypothetical protein
MATYSATLYLPGQPAYPLTPADIAKLGIDAEYLNGQPHLQARPGQVNKWLGALDSEPLATSGRAAVFGIFDYYGPEEVNQLAEPHTLRLFDLGGLWGPLLVIEETTEQNSLRLLSGGLASWSAVSAA